MDSPVMAPDSLPDPAVDNDNASLPTPPSTPPPLSHPINSAISVVDSLLAFYHQERMWVYRTRASLELVLEAAPSAGSDSTLVSMSEGTVLEEEDYDDEDEGSVSAIAHTRGSAKAELLTPGSAATTLWMRRKKSFKLKLKGISMRGTKRRTTTGQIAPQTPGVQMLELFENMMEARMESCERISRMMKDVNKGNL